MGNIRSWSSLSDLVVMEFKELLFRSVFYSFNFNWKAVCELM